MTDEPLQEEDAVSEPTQLNEAEIAVLAHAAAGLTWQEVSQAVGASERTVRRRFAEAAAKLGTSGVVQTVAVAVARQLVDLDRPPEPTVVTRQVARAESTPRPRRTIETGITQLCEALPVVHGNLRQACAIAGVSYSTLINRQTHDADLRRVLLDAGWVPRKKGPSQRVAAAIEVVLTRMSDGATITEACAAAGITYNTLVNWRGQLPELDTEITRLLEENRRREPAWVGALLTALESGATFGRACEEAGVKRVTAYEVRRKRPDVNARVVAAIAVGKQRSHESRWRQGARDDRARREHNKATRDQRRRKTLERFTPDLERSVLEAIRNGVPLPQAAAEVGMTQQTLFGRARFDPAWAARVDRALMQGRDPGINHGTSHAYKAHRCRCPECREAHARTR